MASIVLKYDARNPIARKTIDYVLSLGLFETAPPQKTNPYAESDDDIAQGRVYEAKDADDLIRQCLCPS